MHNVQNRHEHNYRFSQTDAFVPWMNAALAANLVEIFRLHPAGDFFDAEYTAKWLSIIRQNKGIRFFGYTRSWSDPAISRVLRRLARLDNLRLWYSIDKDSGLPEHIPPGVRLASMALDDDQANAAPKEASLVFRNHPTTLMKKSATGVMVCPYENGLLGVARKTCTLCKICFR